jgi:hypothetical protein
MGERLELSALLHSLTDNVYFQEPENIQMVYPCILYKTSDEDNRHANNRTYSSKDEYEVTIMDYDPDSDLRKAFRDLRIPCSFDRIMRVDGLNHFIYSLYY